MRVLENPLHPARLRLEVEGLSTAALDAAVAAHPERGFTCIISESDQRAAALLTARGFASVRRTVEGGWRGDPSLPMPVFEHGTLAQRPELTQPWLAAHRQHYFATHRDNPPAALDGNSWNDLFLGGDFWPETAFYILDGNDIAAFSSLREAKGGWELAWFGTVPENHLSFAGLNAGLVALETQFMAGQGIPSVLVEWDSTSPDAAWREQQYTLENPHTYLTFTLTA